MAGRLQGRVALVTGAGSIGPGWGNGKATAVLFAREGAKVFAVDLKPRGGRGNPQDHRRGGRGLRHASCRCRQSR
jgi:NAD(P)-dependent dehydrogenase (short-subunit alcohol dehydrogenase family)